MAEGKIVFNEEQIARLEVTINFQLYGGTVLELFQELESIKESIEETTAIDGCTVDMVFRAN